MGESFLNEERIVAAFEISNVANTRGEVPTGSTENSGLADLTAELVAKSGLMCRRGDLERIQEATAL